MHNSDSYEAVLEQLTAVHQSIANIHATCLHEQLLNEECKELVQQALLLVQQAVLDREAAESYQQAMAQLDMNTILHILSFLSDSYKALTGKLVCKDAYQLFAECKKVKPSYVELDKGHILEILQQHAWNVTAQQKLTAIVVKQGSLSLIQYLRQQGCAWDETACEAAAWRGDLAMLQWLRSQHPACPWDGKTCEAAAYSGNLEVLRWASSQEPACPWGPYMYDDAAASGNVEMLQWLQAQECPYQRGYYSVCGRAASKGDLKVLQWARSQEPPFDWGCSVCWKAASEGHLEVLQWLRAQDAPWPKSDTNVLNLYCAAARNGDVAMLSWLEAQDPSYEWHADVCREAAENGHISTLQWLRSQEPPCPWNESVCSEAIAQGQVEVLHWLRAQNPPCPWGADTLVNAVTFWHIREDLDVLRWARGQQPPCPWNERVCSAAAWYSLSAGLLQWLRSQRPPCPWDQDVCVVAAREGCLDVLQWALAQDPPAHGLLKLAQQQLRRVTWMYFSG